MVPAHLSFAWRSALRESRSHCRVGGGPLSEPSIPHNPDTRYSLHGVTLFRAEEQSSHATASCPGARKRGHCRSLIAGYKIPRCILFVPTAQTPVNPSGKIMKRKPRQRPLWPDLVEHR